jgi:hypothetical protein
MRPTKQDKMLKDIWKMLEMYRITAESLRDEYEAKSSKSLEWRACANEVESIQDEFKDIVGNTWFKNMLGCLPPGDK